MTIIVSHGDRPVIKASGNGVFEVVLTENQVVAYRLFNSTVVGYVGKTDKPIGNVESIEIVTINDR